jgi:predicted metal-dependent phosphoesterase TrpH
VEGYLKWITVLRKKGYQVDGIALTEHRSFDFEVDYTDLADQYGALVLKGSEVETDLGHVLVYGVTPWLVDQFDFKNIALPAHDIFQAVKDAGGYAVAAHPGRTRIGLWEHIQNGASLDGIRTIERLNGGSNADENALAAKLAEGYGFSCVGGSDSHYVSTIGRCITRFEGHITRVEELVEELSLGNHGAATLEDTRVS